MYSADLNHPDKTLQEKLTFLFTLSKGKTVDLGFRKPFTDLLKALGQPQNHLPPIIHVAGTNGKGSVIATMRAILEENGKRVHIYTSPHLKRFNERICLAGKELSDEELEKYIDESVQLNGSGEITFFEITTALAMAAFSRNPADILFLETGLGGRLDCTNVIEKPLASVITTISRDHTEFLGETLEEIAGEKAGIIKPDCPVILGYQRPEKEIVKEVIRKKAEESCSPLYTAGKEWSCEKEGDSMRFKMSDTNMLLSLPSLSGDHQILNAGAALAALKITGQLPEDPEIISKALTKIRWPGRLQKLDKGSSFSRTIPENWEIYVDGGHNDSAGEILASHIKNWKKESDTPVYVILGMLKKKNPDLFLSALLPEVDSAYAVTIPCAPGESWSPELLSEKTERKIYPLSGKTPEEWLQALFRNKKPGKILVCGSIYLAGDML